MSLLSALLLSILSNFAVTEEKPRAWFNCYNDAPDSMTCFGTLY